MTLHAYRFFSNTCREAMEFYRDVFGGSLDVMTFADLPPGEGSPEGVDPDLVVHASLTLPDGSLLMASDHPSGDGWPVKGVSIRYTAPTIEGANASSTDWPTVARSGCRSRRCSGRSGSGTAPTGSAPRG